ncbi:46460_t:CDS:2, partial [Gigaspora margarita]
MKELEPFLLEYDNKDLTKLVKKNISSEEKRHCEYKLRRKGHGRSIHISEFLCEPLGRVHLNEEQHTVYPEIPKWYVTELLEIVQTIKQLERAIDILEIALPDTIFVFEFDNSSSHGAFAKDVLIASKMSYGGKQSKLRPGRFSDSTLQAMNRQLRGKYIKCSKDEDEIMHTRGAIKRYSRSYCDYTFKGLKKTVPEAFDSMDIITIRKFARKAWRYMDGYRKGLIPSAAKFA